MSFVGAVRTHWLDFLTSASDALQHGTVAAWKSVPGGPQEPDYVSKLIQVSVPHLATHWIKLFQQLNCLSTVFGAFVHQSPKIHYVGMQGDSVEVGDILFVHVHWPKNAGPRSAALLLQAKKSPLGCLVPAIPDDQFRLYYEWPELTYVSPTGLKGRIRDVLPKQDHAGAQYLLIDPAPIRRPHMPNRWSSVYGTAKTEPSMNTEIPLELALCALLTKSSGRTFDISPSAKDGWSLFINDLLNHTLVSFYNRRAANANRQPRLAPRIYGNSNANSKRGIVVVLLGEDKASQLLSGFGKNPPDTDDLAIPAEPPEGISIVVVETFESEAG